MRKYLYISTLSIVVLLLAGTGLKKEITLSGQTMGTTYHIKIITTYFDNLTSLKNQINKRLDEINKSMSIYMKESDISKFNTSPLNTRIQVSDDFILVMKTGKSLYIQTQGAWDGTVGPLVNLWGFGSKEMGSEIPSEDKIKKELEKVGFDRIEILEDRYLSKNNSTVSLDLGSIAKGYGVDQVAKLIKNNNIEDFLVEIGGEVYASGRRKDGKSWRIGINTPRKDASANQVHKVVNLYNKAMATSGDYRNFIEIDGKIYSHIIDPRTGYPVSNQVVSVSIISDSCTYADGLATAVMVMGKTKGLELVSHLNNTECMIVIMEKDSTLVEHYSDGFRTEP